MRKYKLVVADVTNPTYSKMSATVAQHLAVSFGYPLRNFQPGAGEVLVFDPNTKDVAVSNRAFLKNKAIHSFTADYLVGALENPEVDVTTIDAGDGVHSASVFEDSITFRSKTSKLVGTVTVPKTFIKKVMGAPTSGLPIVDFHYPDSQCSYSTLLRRVRVTRFDDEWLWGYEMRRGNVQFPSSEQTLKKYNPDRIEGLAFRRFVQDEK